MCSDCFHLDESRDLSSSVAALLGEHEAASRMGQMPNPQLCRLHSQGSQTLTLVVFEFATRFQAVTKTTQTNASHAWTKIKNEGFLNMNGVHVETHRIPGQRGGRPSEVVDIPTALQIIMVLPGKTAAKVRVKASVLFGAHLIQARHIQLKESCLPMARQQM
jgi:hypothetical protein